MSDTPFTELEELITENERDWKTALTHLEAGENKPSVIEATEKARALRYQRWQQSEREARRLAVRMGYDPQAVLDRAYGCFIARATEKDSLAEALMLVRPAIEGLREAADFVEHNTPGPTAEEESAKNTAAGEGGRGYPPACQVVHGPRSSRGGSGKCPPEECVMSTSSKTVVGILTILLAKRAELCAAIVAADKEPRGGGRPRGFQAEGSTEAETTQKGVAWLQGRVDAAFLLPALRQWHQDLQLLGVPRLPPWSGEPQDETATLSHLDQLITACRSYAPGASAANPSEVALPSETLPDSLRTLDLDKLDFGRIANSGTKLLTVVKRYWTWQDHAHPNEPPENNDGNPLTMPILDALMDLQHLLGELGISDESGARWHFTRRERVDALRALLEAVREPALLWSSPQQSGLLQVAVEMLTEVAQAKHDELLTLEVTAAALERVAETPDGDMQGHKSERDYKNPVPGWADELYHLENEGVKETHRSASACLSAADSAFGAVTHGAPWEVSVESMRRLLDSIREAGAGIEDMYQEFAQCGLPAQIGKVHETSAHAAALAFAKWVLREIWTAAVPPQKWMDDFSLAAVEANYAQVVEHFRGLSTPDLGNAHALLLREAIIADKARSSWRFPRNEQAPELPVSDVQAPAPGGTVAEPADTAGRQRRKRGTVNQRMLEHLSREPASCHWTQRQWASFLQCKPSAIAKARAWQTAKAARALAVVDRLERRSPRSPAAEK
jgi:hypothetical protein